jgi:hypothetical protein
MCRSLPHAELSSRLRSGRALLLHGQSAGAEANPARRPYRVLARGGRDDAGRNHPFTKARRGRGIWQRRSWGHLIRDDAVTHEMPNIATSIRSSTARSSACATGRIHRFIATWARGCFRSIGAAISKRPVSLVSGGIGEANFKHGTAAWNGGLRLQLQSAPGYALFRRDHQPRFLPQLFPLRSSCVVRSAL